MTENLDETVRLAIARMDREAIDAVYDITDLAIRSPAADEGDKVNARIRDAVRSPVVAERVVIEYLAIIESLLFLAVDFRVDDEGATARADFLARLRRVLDRRDSDPGDLFEDLWRELHGLPKSSDSVAEP